MMFGVAARKRRGQTLIIAIMVMFILAVVATVFIALVARNLARSARMSSTDAVAALAEAGIRYADEMLTTSEDGADWRPVPDGLGSLDSGDIAGNTPPTRDDRTTLDGSTPNWQYLQKNDPDFQWVRAYWPTEGLGYCGPTGGYTRFNSGQGRFLLRVSYNPDPDVPMTKYIKIESVGRWGTIEPGDPTTLHDAGSVLLRREITAYKPMGLTDSCRFITNKDNRSVDVALGVPGFRVSFGRSGTGVTGSTETSKYGVRGGPIRVNANLLWYGDPTRNPSVNIYLRGIKANGPADDPTGGSPTDLIPIDDVMVTGEIKADTDPADDQKSVGVRVHELIKGSSGGTFTDNPLDVKVSADPAFITADSFYRDGSDKPDLNNRPRGVKRIEPPLVDQPDSTNTTTRYRVLTLNSGDRVRQGGNGRWVNLGALGWGKGVYINNTSDKQDESETLFGGYTLRADLMQPGNIMSACWKGPYYVPPAAVITLVPDDKQTVNGTDQYIFSITRDDVSSGQISGQKAIWFDATGLPRPDWGATVRMPYPDSVNGRYLIPNDPSSHIDGNGVIFAEGNIRIRGMLPKGMKLTIVSNQNIYIDGSVLKYRDPKWDPKSTDEYRGADSTGGIALLARQNVIVNTTQFFTPLGNIGSDDYGTDSLTGGNSSHVIVRNNPESALRCGFEFGPFESENARAPKGWLLFIRHSGEFGPAYINAWLNPADTTANWGILNLNTGVYPGLPPHVWGVGDPRYGFGSMPPGAGVGSAFACNVFDLDTSGATIFTAPGVPNILQIALDSNVYTRSNYWMGGLAVLPMDVRIEAIIYAQEGSLFVIPGYWLNPNPADNEKAYAENGTRPPGVDPRFPFYGQPPDIRITIDGAVSENLPASISDVEDWMAKWGRIPETYGSDGSANTRHPNEGITFLYDDHVGWPLDDTKKPIRTDAYGRALPLTPRLPVSGSLIYFGDVM